MPSHWSGGIKCPICRKDSSECPHSFVDMDKRAADDHIRKIVQQELRKHKCHCEIKIG